MNERNRTSFNSTFSAKHFIVISAVIFLMFAKTIGLLKYTFRNGRKHNLVRNNKTKKKNELVNNIKSCRTLFDITTYMFDNLAAVSTGAGDTKINSAIGLLL